MSSDSFSGINDRAVEVEQKSIKRVDMLRRRYWGLVLVLVLVLGVGEPRVRHGVGILVECGCGCGKSALLLCILFSFWFHVEYIVLVFEKTFTSVLRIRYDIHFKARYLLYVTPRDHKVN